MNHARAFDHKYVPLTTDQYAKKYNGLHRQAIADTRFVVLENRDNHRQTDDPKDGPWTMNVVFNTTPLAPNSQGSLVAHQMLSGGCMSFDNATFLLHTLFFTAGDMKMFPFSQCDKRVQAYITNNIAPIEWHDKLNARDPHTMVKYQVFCFDVPSLPTEQEEEAAEAWYCRGERPANQTNHAYTISQLREMAEAKGGDEVPLELIFNCAAALLECHDKASLSLDNWKGPRELVEYAIDGKITENHA